METYIVNLSFESVDEILWCDHSVGVQVWFIKITQVQQILESTSITVTGCDNAHSMANGLLLNSSQYISYVIKWLILHTLISCVRWVIKTEGLLHH